MRHRVRTTKFKYGRNADRLMTRTLLKNFVISGRMISTEKKIKHAKQQIEKLVQLSKKNTEASRLVLRSRLNDKKVEEILMKQVVPVFKERVSGFTTLVHLTQRDSDGASIAKLQWSLPVVLEKPVKKEKKSKAAVEVKEEKKQPAKPKVEVKTPKKK